MLIKENGTYNITPDVSGANADSMIVYVSGVSGGAVLTLQHLDEGNNFVDLEDGVLVVSSENLINAGAGAKIVLAVTGATGTTAVYVTARGLS